MRLPLFLILATLPAVAPAFGQSSVSLSRDMVLDTNALLMPSSALFGRSINGVSFQTEPLITRGNYQYATWYHLGSADEDIYIARRSLSGNTWETLDTGLNLDRGDATPLISSTGNQQQPWDAHNVISMGISGDGRIHLSYDHHSSDLRYIQSAAGGATATTWSKDAVFGGSSERSALNAGGSTVAAITYPRFISNPNSTTGDMLMTYRTGSSGSGNMFFSSYNSGTGQWDAAHQIIQGTDGSTYSDARGSSTSRNAYLNGIDVGTDGRLHTTFTWRETAGGANHDIMYASSNDGGQTWQNNSGANITSFGGSINLNSSGIIIGSDTNPSNPLGKFDRNQTLMNQQTQAVDTFGGVHALMWHRQPGTFGDGVGDNTFDTRDSAYYHYFRDPITGVWSENQIPLVDSLGNPIQVSSRPKIGYDVNGNLFAVYVAPPGVASSSTTNYYADGYLVVAGATKINGYNDWSILWQDRSRLYAGEPLLDQDRLYRDGILSVFLQETSNITSVTGTSLHVLEFNVSTAVPEPAHLLALLSVLIINCSRRRRLKKRGQEPNW